jgi:hypothetical protein
MQTPKNISNEYVIGMKVYRKTKLETPCNPAVNRAVGRSKTELRRGGFVNK